MELNRTLIPSVEFCDDSASDEDDYLHINVGGRVTVLPAEAIMKRMPTSRLAEFYWKEHEERLIECDSYSELDKEYYFERNSSVFELIIDILIYGVFHVPPNFCDSRIHAEFEYWKIPERCVGTCCNKETDDIGDNDVADVTPSEPQFYSPSDFENILLGKYRYNVYAIFECPRHSFISKCISAISTLFVVASLLGLVLSSIPELQTGNREPILILNYLENCCMFYFIVEYSVRIFVNPHKTRFIIDPLNMIDLLTILPFILEAFKGLKWFSNIRGTMMVVRLLRLARVARVFKLARYHSGLRTFASVMKNSATEFSLLAIFLSTGVMLFSTAIYFFERDEPNTKFTSIPVACWWCINTMTTVGYGDLVPTTTGGKFIAAVGAVGGIIVLAFPVSMIIDKLAQSTRSTRGISPPPFKRGRRFH